MVFRNDVGTTSRFTEKIATFVVNVEMFVMNAAVFTKNVVTIVVTG